ncbi:hypothetical protein COV17_02130 [Candidatus Woesearchaeota archaeon CG10_big_fil_rev_8_21_14_0_10_36_11]|nr:MAG: hypothetical protein COV17_02130 [Candidatus Woesearchaeota archaeon CG10_big_fil_rev_8_21_14_0_10_36_11]
MTPARKIASEVLTVMFIDIVNYTKTTAELSRDSFSQLHEAFDTLCIPMFKEYDGNVIQKIGDAFLITFKSATNAVLCGMELQRRFIEYNKRMKPKKPLWIRVAIHTGEVIKRKSDVHGDAVNTTARIESITKSGDVVFSETVFHAMNKNEISYAHIGLRKFKGVKHPVRLFRVRNGRDKVIARQQYFNKIKRFVKLVIAFVVIFGVLFFLRAVLLKYLLR